MVAKIKSQNLRIRAIDQELGQPELSVDLWEPKLDSKEFPDDREEVTEAELEAFRRSRQSTSWIKAIAPSNSTCTGAKTVIKVNAVTGDYDVIKKPITGFVAVESAEDLKNKVTTVDDANSEQLEDDKEVYQDKKHYEVDDRIMKQFIHSHDGNKNNRKQLDLLENVIPGLMIAKKAFKSMISSSSKLQNPPRIIKEKIAERERQLRHERDHILLDITKSVNSFREALENLKKLRHETTVDIKQAELKLVLYCNEYSILHGFEEKDVATRDRKAKVMRDKTDIQQNLLDLDDKLQSKVIDCEKCKQNLKETEARKLELIPVDSQFAANLHRIYKKKVKLSEDEDEYDDDESEEEDEENDDEGGEDLEDVEDICPPGCPIEVYEELLRLRSVRIQMEMDEKVANKQLEECKRAIERANLKEKQYDKELAGLDSEIYQLQLTKQAALNQVPIFVPLLASQIYPFQQSGALSGPEVSRTEEDRANTTSLLDVNCRKIVDDMTMGGAGSYILMDGDALKKLQSRIEELHHEIDEAKGSLKDLQRRKGAIEKKLRDDFRAIEAKKHKATQVQMMKFGGVIDIDELEKKSDKSSEEEINRQIEEIERNFRKEQSKMIRKRDKLTDKLVEVTKINTTLMKELGELTSKKLEIGRELNHLPPVTTGDDKLAELQEQKEMRKLTIFLEQTEREIEMVRNEISMLKRKDRQHVLPYIPERPSLRSTTAPDGARRLSGGLGGENLPSMNSGAGGNKEDGDKELIRDKENRGVNRQQRPKSSVARSAIPVQSF